MLIAIFLDYSGIVLFAVLKFLERPIHSILYSEYHTERPGRSACRAGQGRHYDNTKFTGGAGPAGT